MREKLQSQIKSDTYPVAVKDVLVQSALDVVRRVDRVAVALCVTAVTGLGLEKLIASGAHAVVVLIATGFAGALIMHGCIALMVGKARFLKPSAATANTAQGILLATTVSGGIFGVAMSVVWFVLPDSVALLPGFYFGPEWRAWHLLGFAAMATCVLSIVLTCAWPLAVAYDYPYALAVGELEKYGDLETLYDTKQWWGHVVVLMIIATTVPVLCMVVPVWYAITISRLFERVWNNRSLAEPKKKQRA